MEEQTSDGLPDKRAWVLLDLGPDQLQRRFRRIMLAMCMYVPIYVCMCVCMYVCMCVCVDMCMCACNRMYVYACMCACIWICLCVYLHRSVRLVTPSARQRKTECEQSKHRHCQAGYRITSNIGIIEEPKRARLVKPSAA